MLLRLDELLFCLPWSSSIDVYVGLELPCCSGWMSTHVVCLGLSSRVVYCMLAKSSRDVEVG